MKRNNLLALIGVFGVLCLYLLVSISDKSSAAYFDNTNIESKVNITNVAPTVNVVNMYEYDDLSQIAIDLSEGTTETIVCNATVDDWNGWSDIVGVNATIYDDDSYDSEDAPDNNYNYFQGSCTNSSVNVTALEFSCSFSVWYYANNASWNCNVSAVDSDNLTATAIDASAPTINALAAINLSTNLVDFGEMQPGETTTNAEEKLVNVTNSGNVLINLSVDGFGATDGDDLAMNCTQGNITIDYLKYNVTSDQNFDSSMWNLTDSKLSEGIPGFNIQRRTDDADNSKLNSTNSTFWKLRTPIGLARGFCNGTMIFSAVV